MNRKRSFQSVLIIATIATGLLSRKLAALIPYVVVDALGDIFWALLVYWLLGFISPCISIRKAVLIALTFSFLMELTQLYHSNYIDHLRSTFLGSLILGYNFVWTDLLCYTAGILLGALFEIVYYNH